MNNKSELSAFAFMDDLVEFCDTYELSNSDIGTALVSNALSYLDDNLYNAAAILEELATHARIHAILLNINRLTLNE